MLNFLQSTKTCTVEFGSGGTQDQSRPGALSVLEISGMMICNSYIYDISLRNPRYWGKWSRRSPSPKAEI